jgi:hypothetical protein
VIKFASSYKFKLLGQVVFNIVSKLQVSCDDRHFPPVVHVFGH